VNAVAAPRRLGRRLMVTNSVNLGWGAAPQPRKMLLKEVSILKEKFSKYFRKNKINYSEKMA
jgi:hypothetical protein